jgi:arylsulfatase A-like enzyme
MLTPLRILLTSLVASVALGLPPVASAQDKRPNIILCIADDWGFPDAGAYGHPVCRTPSFDRVAAEGALFLNAHCASPSCTPSRAALLTGQAIHRLEDSGNLWSVLPRKFETYPDLLEAAGYFVGLQGKGWGPGSLEGTGRTRNPAGPNFKSFEAFLAAAPAGKPFCFWLGHRDPHRPYEKGQGLAASLKLEDARVPPFLPDTPEVRSDLLDYYAAVMRFDRDVGAILKMLDERKLAENTFVVITSDNGMPFPRCKANLYGSGTHEPLAIRWPARFKGGTRVEAFVSLADLAPTFLEAAGIAIPAWMTGRSVLPLAAGGSQPDRDRVFVGRERHANVRAGDLSYPARAIRTKEFLYIRNFRPDRWPAGDPQMYKAVGPFGDIDGGPAKEVVLMRRQDKEIAPFFRMACEKRPAEEMYDLSRDPHELVNVAEKAEFAAAKAKLRAALDKWMADTADPRAASDDDRWDKYKYFGSEPKKKAK